MRNTVIVVATTNDNNVIVNNYTGCVNGFYKEETLGVSETLEVVFGHYMHGDIHDKKELQELIDYNTKYGYEYISVPHRNEFSEYSFSARQHLNLFRLAEINPEFYEFCIELLEENESDYVYMVALSGLKAAQDSIDPFEVEPWAHTVYTTYGGHICCSSLMPYFLFKIFGRMSNEKIQKAVNMNITHIGNICAMLNDTEWYRVAITPIHKRARENFSHFLRWFYCDEEYWDKRRRFSSLEGLIKFLDSYEKEVHYSGRGWEEKKEVLGNLYDKYKDYLPMERRFYENILEYEFKKLYGRAPRCIRLLSALYYHDGYDSIRKVVDNFNFKIINNLKKTMPLDCAIKCCIQGLNPTGFSIGMAMTLLECDSKEAVKWVLAHKDTDDKILCHVLAYPDCYDLSWNITAIKQRYELLKGPGYMDFVKYKDEVPERQAPDMPSVSIDGVEAYCLDLSTDTGMMQAFGLGYDTHCCQRVGGAGESAMFYSLKYGEFLVFKKNGKLLAQAACWTAEGGEFVLDNIEFTNNRDASEIVPALSRWCSLLRNKDVVMGTGYNALTLGLEEKDSDTIGLVQQKHDMEYIYTDTTYIVELKKEGEVLI